MKENIFKSEFLDNASKLDAVSNGCGAITRAATSVVDTQDKASSLFIVNTTSDIIKSPDYANEIKRIASVCKDSLMRYYGYLHLMEKLVEAPEQAEDARNLSELLDELNQLVGLANVKATVNDLIAYQKVRKMREEHGLYAEKETMHLAFTGNPGTGKTTVARIIGHVYKQLGLLSKGHFLEVSRTDLIAGYQGQTALKVKKVVEQAKGGVLFIDEAYSITENDHSDSYGRECLTELTKALEDYRDDLVVIVAGYTEPMKKFFESNPGLKSRFNTFIEFGDYSGEELYEILLAICKKNSYSLERVAAETLKSYLSNLALHKEDEFANGRLVRNLFDDLVLNHARRVSMIESPSKEQLMELTIDDVPVQKMCSQKEDTIMSKESGQNPNANIPISTNEESIEKAISEKVNLDHVVPREELIIDRDRVETN